MLATSLGSVRGTVSIRIPRGGKKAVRSFGDADSAFNGSLCCMQVLFAYRFSHIGMCTTAGPCKMLSSIHVHRIYAWRGALQGSQELARRLGWHMDVSGTVGDLDTDACVDRIEALFRRAEFYAQGKRVERETHKVFSPDWQGLQREKPVQAEVAQLMVCTHSLCVFNHVCCPRFCCATS